MAENTQKTNEDISNLEFDFKSNPLGLSSGDVVDVKVEHFNTGQSLDFEATIYGYA